MSIGEDRLGLLGVCCLDVIAARSSCSSCQPCESLGALPAQGKNDCGSTDCFVHSGLAVDAVDSDAP